MKDRLKLTRKLSYIITSGICILASFIALLIFLNDCRLELISVDANGKILSVEYKGTEVNATVEYKVQGETYTVPVHIENKNQELMINDDLPIKYDINNPGKIIYNDHITEILIILFISMIGIIFTLPTSIKLIKEYRYIVYLKENGLNLIATVFDVYVDTKTKKYRGKFPYRLRCKYVNPEDNKEYVYDSDYSYIDLNKVIRDNKTKEVAVFIDKDNTNKYYVDLDSLLETYVPRKEGIEDEANKEETIKEETTE